MKKIIVLSVLVSVLFSCSVVKIEKRRFRKGFHVSLNKQGSRVQKKSISESLEHNEFQKDGLTNELSFQHIKEKSEFKIKESSISNKDKNFKKDLLLLKKGVREKMIESGEKELLPMNQTSIITSRKPNYQIKDQKVFNRSSMVDSDIEDGDPTILRDGAKIGLSFITTLISFAGIIGVLMAAFIIAWNSAGIASMIISISILVGGTYLVLFLSVLAFLNIFRRESQRGDSFSKKAARITGLLFLIGLFLVALRIGISWLMV